MENKTPILKLKDITKRFGDITANEKVCLDVYEGEILALLGENGSGKTTLMNMISGIYFPDEGEIMVKGQPVSIAKPEDAFNLGIGMIHQHFKLVDVLTATENIILGLKEKGGLDLKKAAERIKEICDTYGFEIDPNQKIYNMSVSQKQTVEIVKVLYRGADILILDEPTAVLTPQEAEKLFNVLRNMKKDGKSVIIITHKLNEVMEISDRVTILRKGHYICDMETKSASVQALTDAMVGHAVELNIDRPEPVNPKPRIQVDHLTVRSQDGVLKLKDVSFTANSGEILGIAGIAGNGQKELLEAIAGLQPAESGDIYFIEEDGSREELLGMDPLKIAGMGVSLSFVPEDRLGMGLVGNMNLAENMMLRSFRKGKGVFTDRKAPYDLAEHVVEELEVNTPSVFTPVRKLSGGNVQKVLVGREIASAPTVLLTAYAVRGLDINSSYMIYDLINRQKKRGVAVVYVGEDLDVLLELCDRILVLCDGQVSGILDGKTAQKNEVGLMMTKVGGGEAE
ncbi:MAG: ABC transporter ATP-binding protein [Lachnospiraceae bacterium]|nr:ABC transporter ATP-binding protein [Lachnospiraceae bacterium]